MKANSMRIWGTMAVVAVMLLGLMAISYGQPYEPEHLWHRQGEEAGDFFGYYVAGIGDVNGDGCEDFITYEKEPDTRAMVFFGGDPPDTIPDVYFNNPCPYGYFGGGLENLGDVNGDGWEDFSIHGGYQTEGIHRVFIYFGGQVLDTIPDVVLSEAGFYDGFGSNIEGVSDVNGDGYDDVAVHASNYPWPDGHGKVWIYFGGNPMDSIADWEKEGTAIQSACFGQSITGKGDLNGDGFDDFTVYEWTGRPDPAETNYYVFFGGSQLDTIPDVIIYGEEYYPEIDISIPSALIADLDGDPYSDLVIVAGRTTNAVVFHGGNPMDTEIDLVLGGFHSFPMGWSMNVSAAGNVNGDVYDDIIVGQYEADGYGGRVLVYFGSPWMDGQPDIRWIGESLPGHEQYYGETLADCGDINGDGVDDIMFGYPGPSFYPPYGNIDIWKGDTAFVVNVPVESPKPVPSTFYLHPPYPNPFNSSVTILFEVLPGHINGINLKVYNVLGQEVADLTPTIKQAISGQSSGSYQVIWDGKDDQGVDLGSGLYFIQLRNDSAKHIEKVVLLR